MIKKIKEFLRPWSDVLVGSEEIVELGTKADRRSYGMGVRIWDDRDPRADQAYFQYSVPGFVLSQNQKIIDWNIGFELVFSDAIGLQRGMSVSDWYSQMDNFRRLPHREEKLFGEAVLPLTDRERVVFVSPVYGRMVFMKVMAPILDKMTGRILGWNLSLNINSVHHRAKFFEDLYARIDAHSRHARYVAGLEQLLEQSDQFAEFNALVRDQLHGAHRLLIVGALRSTAIIEDYLSNNGHGMVTVVDHDTEALRLIRNKCGRFASRLRLVRKDVESLEGLPKSKFDATIVLWPGLEREMKRSLIESLEEALKPGSPILIAEYRDAASVEQWWVSLGRELEKKGEMDLMRWHLGLVTAEDKHRFEGLDFGIDPHVGTKSFVILGGYGEVKVGYTQKRLQKSG